MSREKYIIASAVIEDRAIYKNGGIIFASEGQGLQQFLTAAYDHFSLNYPKFYKMDSLSKLGWLTSEMVLDGESVHRQLQADEIAVVLCNANSSLDTDFKYYETVKEMASPALFVYTLPNIVMGEICIRNGWKGENAFFIFEKFDADFLVEYVSDLLDNDRASLCLCGWVDVMDETYKASLFLIGTTSLHNSQLFTKENIESGFNRPGKPHAGSKQF